MKPCQLLLQYPSRKLLPLVVLHIILAYEQAVRQQQMRTEMSQAKRENKHYLASVDKGKAIQAIMERKRKRGVEVGKQGECMCVCVYIHTILFIVAFKVSW